MKVFSIRDIKAESFGPLMVFDSAVEAFRAVWVVLENGNSTIARYPEDFHVFSLGDFDSRTGRINVYDSPKFEFSCDSVYREMLERRRGAAVGGVPPQAKPTQSADPDQADQSFPGKDVTPALDL